MLIGEISSLLCALVWAFASFIFKHTVDTSSPYLLNLIKGIFSVVLFGLVMLLQSDPLPAAALKYYLQLIVSGIIGLGVGDSFYFLCLQMIGTRKTLLMETLAPPLTGILSFLYYGTGISFLSWVGMGVTVAGIAIVLDNKTRASHVEDAQCSSYQEQTASADLSTPEPQLTPLKLSKHTLGALCGVGAMLCQAIGMVLSSAAQRSNLFDPMVAAWIRLVAGTLFVFCYMRLIKDRIYYPGGTNRQKVNLIIAIFFGTTVALYFQQLAVQYTRPEIAQTLIATAPIFGILIGRLLGENITRQSVIGTLTAFLGVAIVIRFK